MRLVSRSVLAVAGVTLLLGCSSSPRFRIDEGTPRRGPSSESARDRQQGVASYYGKKFHGRTTSNGELFDMYKLTAAHRSLPFGTKVLVKNLENGREVIVRINDRGPFKLDRVIDLSYAAAKQLEMVGSGTAKVLLKIISLDDDSN